MDGRVFAFPAGRYGCVAAFMRTGGTVRNPGIFKALLFGMLKPPDYLQYARECSRLALGVSEEKDRELLIAMAKAWTELAVEKSAPEPEPDDRSPTGTVLIPSHVS